MYFVKAFFLHFTYLEAIKKTQPLLICLLMTFKLHYSRAAS